MRILVLSFYYRPDLSAGSFRTTTLVDHLREALPRHSSIDVLTTNPNRYRSYAVETPQVETDGTVTVQRISVPPHQSGLVDQSKTFATFALGVRSRVRGQRYDLVYATSSRLMTAFLGARVSDGGRTPLYLDIRDIFVDTVKDVFRGPKATMLLPQLSLIERYTVRAASRVNLVSPGFEGYFRSRYPNSRFDYFTNGIDEEFLATDWQESHPRSGPTRVLYAGNIGQGQGLHAILPELAKATAASHEYVVVGDGGARRLVEDALAKSGVCNVRLLPPVDRANLIAMYRDADVLFLHLNDLPAFEKVLPSKVFEYAATGKPVLAGVAGYSRKFIEREVPNARVFPPCDGRAAVAALGTLRTGRTDRSTFIAKHRRDTIMQGLARAIVDTARTGAPHG